MRIFLDTEFMEDGRVITPLSIGLAFEDGKEYYAEFASIVPATPNEFVREKVIPNLKSWEPYEYTPSQGVLLAEKGAKWKNEICEELLAICGNKPEFWGYFCDYDWVLICQLFGNMTDLPAKEPYNWPFFCLDLKQEMVVCDIKKEWIEKFYPQPTTHNALDDAKWNKNAFNWIRENAQSRVLK